MSIRRKGKSAVDAGRMEKLECAVERIVDAIAVGLNSEAMRRNRSTNELFHWKGRACKVYTKVGGRWLFLFQTGLLEY